MDYWTRKRKQKMQRMDLLTKCASCGIEINKHQCWVSNTNPNICYCGICGAKNGGREL